MPRKKSIKRSVRTFIREVQEIEKFVQCAQKKFKDRYLSWAYEYAIIRLYREFERMMLDALVGAINNDTTTLSKRTGVRFPKHLTDEVCRYLIVGDGYFDFKGRDGLITTLTKYVDPHHYLVTAVKSDKYKQTLGQLCTLRNLAAHNSRLAKVRAKKVVGQERMSDAGSWLKKQGRFTEILERLKELANEIETKAPY
jgi:hypothetical protein